MPCYDPRPEITSLSSENGDLKKQLYLTNKRINYLEAIVCALTKECNEEIILRAEKNGKIKIYEFILEHASNDEDSLKALLYRDFSEHELKIIKKILNKQDDNL